MDANKIIEENNRLIAEFMRWNPCGNGAWHTPYENAGYCNGEPTHICDDRHLKFNSSWDWLMPCVEKIEFVHFEGTDKEVWVDVLIQSENCHIVEKTSQFETIEKIGAKIEATWLAVIEFIQWYNENKES